MSANKITWEDKVALNPRKERVNQWQDQDILELKTKFNANDDRIDALVSGYQGSLAIADTPTNDGYYFASESGTYTNAGSLVVTLANTLTIISVLDNQTTFSKLEVPISTLGFELVSTIGDFNSLVSAGLEGVWMILDDITLTANTTIPNDITLVFNGGVINLGGYTLTGSNTVIDADIKQIFDTNGSIAGTWYNEIYYPQWFGGDNDGVVDNIDAMRVAHELGNVFYVNGTYLFTGENLNLSKNSIQRESDDGVIFTNGIYNGIISFDKSGYLIGLHHNHLQEKKTDPITAQITSGNIIEPPKSTASINSGIDVIATWYNDFGLDAIRDETVGWNGWYTWEWAHTDSAVDLTLNPNIQRGYQDKRHPFLGWYRGDDQNVLDWQSYWLSEYGVNGVIVQPRGTNVKLDATVWNNTSNINNWIYKLLNTVPNAENLKFITWCDSSQNSGDATDKTNMSAAWDNNIQLLHDSGKAYVVNYGTFNYICVYVFEGEFLRGLYDNYSGSTNTKAFLEDKADFAKTLGYDGICVMARNATAPSLMNRGSLLNSGVLYIGNDYTSSSDGTGSPFSSYSDLVDDFNHGNDNYGSIVTIPLDLESTYHPSNKTASGSTPALFKKLFKKAIDFVYKDINTPNIINLYNVSEWAEGGAGLMPTIGNEFDYLEAVKESLNSGWHISQIKNINEINYKPTSTINFKGSRVSIASDFSQTFTFTPAFRDGYYEGEEIEILHYDAVANGSTITLSDNSVTAGTKLYFKTNANTTIKPKRTLRMKWNSFLDGWEEI